MSLTSTAPGGPALADGGDQGTAAPRRTDFWHNRRTQSLILTTIIGPAALVAVLGLRQFGFVAKEPVWVWIVILTVMPLVSVLSESLDTGPSTRLRVHARVAWHAAVVTTVIYLTGWGPVLIGAFAFATLQTMLHDGSRAWRVSAAWSIVGVAIGQLLVFERLAPSFLADGQAQALGLMGAFVLLFLIRMAAATVSQKEQAEASMRASETRYRSLVQHSSDVTLVLGMDDRITYASPATFKLLGWTPEQVVGMADFELLHPDDQERMANELGPILEQSTAATEPMSVRLRHADGTWRHVEVVVTNLCQEPTVAGYVCNIRDITERKNAEALLVYQALHDPLTGLPNRTVILDRAEQLLARARRNGQPVTALFIDLDNFKDVNDTLGHGAGDHLLQAVADRFQSTVRESDSVGRFGGDEFVVLTDGRSPDTGPEVLVERLRQALRAPVPLPGLENVGISVSASIGVASGVYPSATELLRDADTALYRAKASGKDRCAHFAPAMQLALQNRIELTRDLRTAVEDRQFFLVFEPLFDLDTLRVRGVESLLRWQHPVRGVVGPVEFISTLEETGGILELGGWILHEACRQAARLRQRHGDLSVSVNVSTRQLETDAFLDDVERALRATDLPPHALTLEITETALMRDAEAAVGRLQSLKELGIRLSIDDFGTGYSSLAYLQRFPVDEVKVDRSFVSSMAESSESAAIIHTLVELSNTLGLVALAEGIETPQQLESLRREGCHRGQGYFLGRPSSPQAIEEMLSAGVPRLEPYATPPHVGTP